MALPPAQWTKMRASRSTTDLSRWAASSGHGGEGKEDRRRRRRKRHVRPEDGVPTAPRGTGGSAWLRRSASPATSDATSPSSDVGRPGGGSGTTPLSAALAVRSHSAQERRRAQARGVDLPTPRACARGTEEGVEEEVKEGDGGPGWDAWRAVDDGVGGVDGRYDSGGKEEEEVAASFAANAAVSMRDALLDGAHSGHAAVAAGSAEDIDEEEAPWMLEGVSRPLRASVPSARVATTRSSAGVAHTPSVAPLPAAGRSTYAGAAVVASSTPHATGSQAMRRSAVASTSLLRTAFSSHGAATRVPTPTPMPAPAPAPAPATAPSGGGGGWRGMLEEEEEDMEELDEGGAGWYF